MTKFVRPGLNYGTVVVHDTSYTLMFFPSAVLQLYVFSNPNHKH